MNELNEIAVGLSPVRPNAMQRTITDTMWDIVNKRSIALLSNADAHDVLQKIMYDYGSTLDHHRVTDSVAHALRYGPLTFLKELNGDLDADTHSRALSRRLARVRGVRV